jgi:hypothetical protein
MRPKAAGCNDGAAGKTMYTSWKDMLEIVHDGTMQAMQGKSALTNKL